MSKVTLVVCGYCDRTRKVNADGTVRKHESGVSKRPCTGSGTQASGHVPSPIYATITADAITDEQIDELRARLFARKLGDELELHGLVACHNALGRSHRRVAARALCAEIANIISAEAT